MTDVCGERDVLSNMLHGAAYFPEDHDWLRRNGEGLRQLTEQRRVQRHEGIGGLVCFTRWGTEAPRWFA